MLFLLLALIGNTGLRGDIGIGDGHIETAAILAGLDPFDLARLRHQPIDIDLGRVGMWRIGDE